MGTNTSDSGRMGSDTTETAVREELCDSPGTAANAGDGVNLDDRVGQFLDKEGEKIREETERVQSPIIARARQEYKQRLATFLVDEREKIRVETQEEAVAIKARAESDARDIIARAQVEGEAIRTDGRKQAERMMEDAIRAGRADRERVIAEGQDEVNRIVGEARRTSERLTAEAAEVAMKNSEEAVEDILAEARAKAREQSQAIISNSWQRAQQMLDSAESAYKSVRTQLQGCVRAIIEADSNMEMCVSPGSDSKRGQDDLEFESADPEPVAD